MLLLQYAGLLAGVLFGLGRADADMGIWTIDSSCSAYPNGDTSDPDARDLTSKIENAFNTFQDALEAALDDLTWVLRKLPPRTGDEDEDLEGHWKWIRIAESMQVTLGWTSQANKDETKTSHQGWKFLFDVLERASEALQGPDNNPKYGYNPELQVVPSRLPLITCGDGSWQYIKPDEVVPWYEKQLKDIPMFQTRQAQGAVGAWYLHQRIKGSYNGKRPVFDDDPTGTRAAVTPGLNLVRFADNRFTDETTGMPTISDAKYSGGVEPGQMIGSFLLGLDHDVIHEMMHWFGGEREPKGTGYLLVDDKPLVDANGNILFLDEPASKSQKKEVYRASVRDVSDDVLARLGYKRLYTYGPAGIFNLARSHAPGSPQAARTGHLQAMYNADSLALLIVMLFLNDWNWANGGIARHPDKAKARS